MPQYLILPGWDRLSSTGCHGPGTDKEAQAFQSQNHLVRCYLSPVLNSNTSSSRLQASSTPHHRQPLIRPHRESRDGYDPDQRSNDSCFSATWIFSMGAGMVTLAINCSIPFQGRKSPDGAHVTIMAVRNNRSACSHFWMSATLSKFPSVIVMGLKETFKRFATPWVLLSFDSCRCSRDQQPQWVQYSAYEGVFGAGLSSGEFATAVFMVSWTAATSRSSVRSRGLITCSPFQKMVGSITTVGSSVVSNLLSAIWGWIAVMSLLFTQFAKKWHRWAIRHAGTGRSG